MRESKAKPSQLILQEGLRGVHKPVKKGTEGEERGIQGEKEQTDTQKENNRDQETAFQFELLAMRLFV